jgi:hypothetical protein
MLNVRIFSYTLDELIALCERRSVFMVPTLVIEGVHEAEHFAQAKGRQRPSRARHSYLRDRRPVVRRLNVATGNAKVNEIERRTYERWSGKVSSFFSPTW